MKGFIMALNVLAVAFTSCKNTTLTASSGNNAGISICSNPGSSSAHGCEPEKKGGNWISYLNKSLWTANFDLTSILNGECTYRAQGDKIFLARYIANFKVFEYRLEKQQN